MLAMRLTSLIFGLGHGQDLFLGARAPAVGPNESHWTALTQLLQGWQFTTEYAVTVGDHTGELYRYEGGKFTLRTKIPTGSSSKWPSAMMLAGAVDDGSIRSLDAPVHEYVSWWTSNASDPRSEVTMRMLLSFTSGFGDGHPGEEFNSRAARQWRAETGRPQRAPLEAEIFPCNAEIGDVTECARHIYETVKLAGKPGQVYSYNSNHLHLAAAVVVAATGLDVVQVIQKYLIEPYGMTESYYQGKCPDFAGSLVTTGRDYGRFLDGVLNKKVLSHAMIRESERDYTPFLSHNQTLYGNYAFGHFLMCFDSVKGMTPECREAQSHFDPGAFGFMPIIDRKYGYYMQVVAAEMPPTGSYPLSGIPEYLAVAMKPVVEAIMSGNPPDASDFGFHTPRYLSLSVADVNYCLNCRLHPLSCL